MLEMKIFRLVSGTTYTVVGHDGPRALTPGVVNTFATSIPVQPGDVLGVNDAHPATGLSACEFSAPGDSFLTYFGSLGDGESGAFSAEVDYRVNATALVEFPPGIATVAPASGPAAGGTLITIAGHDFTDASAVTFGGVAASSFTVNSDTSITAVSPARVSVGVVDVTVTTPAGNSPLSAADGFIYTPSVNLVSPSSGPRTGGTTVSVAGRAFSGASEVRFGGVPAPSFKVNSDGLITAVSPAASPGTVDITVTTAGEQSPTSAADHFTFNQVCIVPNLKGKTLTGAKRVLKEAHCRLGRVRPTGQTTGSVKRQSRQPGKVLPAGSKINIRLG
jgi:hypothetical protein